MIAAADTDDPRSGSESARHSPRLRRAARVALAIIDQGLSSGANFLAAVLFARWMTPQAFGSVALGLSVSLLLAAVHGVLFLEPISIFGAARYSGRLKEYAAAVTWLSAGWAAVGAILSGLAGFGIYVADGPADLFLALTGVAIGQGPIAWSQCIRRICYVRGLVASAAGVSGIYGVGVALGVWLLASYGWLTPFSAFGLLGGCSALAGTWGYSRIPRAAGDDRLAMSARCPRSILTENLRYGRVLLLAAILQWASVQAYFVLAGAALSVADAGALKALQNLVSPVAQLMAAFGLLFLPYSARAHAAHGMDRLVRETTRYTKWLFLVSLGNGVALLLFGPELVNLLYDGQYSGSASLVAVFGLMPIITALTTGWVGGLRILGRTTGASGIDAAGAIFTLAAGPILILRFGLAGAVWGMVVSTAVRIPLTALNWALVYRERRGSA